MIDLSNDKDYLAYKAWMAVPKNKRWMEEMTRIYNSPMYRVSAYGNSLYGTRDGAVYLEMLEIPEIDEVPYEQRIPDTITGLCEEGGEDD